MTSATVKQSTKSNWNTFWSRKHDVHEVYSNSGRVLRHLAEVTGLRGKKVLEVGAGTGRDSFGLVDLGAEIYQLDYSENALRIITSIARESGAPVHPLCGNAFALPFRDGTFDIVFHQGLLEHFREPLAGNLLQENIRVLRKGGLLLVDVPQRWHLYTLMKHLLIFFNAWFAGWEREFSIGQLERTFRRLGIEPIAAYGEWMYPSLVYRSLREALGTIGVRLPLQPPKVPLASSIRKSVRNGLMHSPLALHTGQTIGVIGRK